MQFQANTADERAAQLVNNEVDLNLTEQSGNVPERSELDTKNKNELDRKVKDVRVVP